MRDPQALFLWAACVNALTLDPFTWKGGLGFGGFLNHMANYSVTKHTTTSSPSSLSGCLLEEQACSIAKDKQAFIYVMPLLVHQINWKVAFQVNCIPFLGKGIYLEKVRISFNLSLF